jgi:hypothetical protein
MSLSLAESTGIQQDISQKTNRSRRLFLAALYTVSLALVGWFIIDGYSYYSTPYAERPHHELYRQLKPAGTTGLLFGYAGSIMMILMLVYSLRKRTRWLGRKVSLQSMLLFHIYLGIMGPLLIVVHTSFKVQGLVAVSFWSMVAVALSGFFGRYLYVQIPRNIQGSELTLQELERMNTEMTDRLQRRFQFDEEALAKLDRITKRFAEGTRGGPFRAVLMLLLGDIFRFFLRRNFVRQVMRAVPMPRRELREFTRQAFARALLQRRVALLEKIQQIFHYWHVIHKPFAIIMYLIMLVHIGVAIWTGYGWVW